MTRELVGQIFGVLILISVVINTQFPKRWQILTAQTFLNLFSAINQLLVGSGFAASLVCFVATVHCPINAYKSKKGKNITFVENVAWSGMYLAAWAVGAWASMQDGAFLWLDLMPLMATLFFFGTVFFEKERNIRLAALANASVYFVYNCINLNSAAVAMLFCIISTLVALYRYRIPKKQDSE